MFNSFHRFTMIAVLAVAGLVAAADAQSKPRVPEHAGQLNLRPGNGANNSSPGNGPSPQWSIGWNIVHAGYCNMYDYGGYTFLVLYPVEGGLLDGLPGLPERDRASLPNRERDCFPYL